MKRKKLIIKLLTFAALATGFIPATTPLSAATMSSGSAAPYVDKFDVASYAVTTGSDKWWPSGASSYGEPGKTVGQTFTTGSEDVALKGFTFQIRGATEPEKIYTIRVGSVSGSTFNEIASETATQSSVTAHDDYWTWTFDSPVILSANTVYGVDVGLNTSTSDWETGIPYVYYTANEYDGGACFRSGTEGYGIGDDSMSLMSTDRVFHIDLGPPDPNAPTVAAGENRVSWSGQAVTLDPNVVNNDTEDPQRSLSFNWTADPAEGVTFTPDANTKAPTVTITKTGNTGDATAVTLTITVTLEGSEPVEDTLTIYVFDDACQAGKGSGSVVIGAGDLNEDCITNLQDFAILAAAWLDDYDNAKLPMIAETWLDGEVLTEPVIAPITVPDVTGMTESAAQILLADSGLTSSSTYEYSHDVALNDVISQNPEADSKAPTGGNVSLVVSKGAPPATEITIAQVYLAQTHVLKPDDSLFKLTGNRNTLLKVHVIGPEGTEAPAVTAALTVDDESTTLTLEGPNTLPFAFEANKGKVEHKHNDCFTALIPAEWIRPGLSIEVKAADKTVTHDIKVGAPSVVKMKMFDVHYFGLGSNDYPAGTLEELESKWPVSQLSVERIRDIDFPELVIPARAGVQYVRVSSRQDYKDQTGLNFDGEQAAALQWVEALSASGGNFDVAMQYINIIGVSAGGQAGGFDGVGGISVGILNHELGHALSLPHWGNNPAYPYKGEMYGIKPQPNVYMETHTGPTWAFDLRTLTFIPPTVQENSVGGEVGCYKKSPMQGGGSGDQEIGFLMRHFSDYAVNKMQSYIEGKVAVLRDGKYYKWDNAAGEYSIQVTNNGVRYPIEQDVQVISVMAAMTLSDMNVNMVYPPIGPYEGNLIRTFDPTIAADRAAAGDVFAPSGGCDFTLRIVQGGQTKTYMLPASGTAGSNLSNSTLKTKAVNLRASGGEVTKVELLLTPDAEINGLPNNPEVLYTWTK